MQAILEFNPTGEIAFNRAATGRWRMRRNPFQLARSHGQAGGTLVRNPSDPAAAIRKRSVVIGGYKTSVSLEDEFWDSIKAIAAEREQSTSDLISAVAKGRDRTNLSSAPRIFTLDHYKQMRGLQ
ncbi:ribbon-helix-helix domain-containing protein [Tardiphaga sp. 71_E8_N1_1]|uniref:ribbon-helix-helix domain-containing protein n=1 Tax=Tardiphaga sp. 71_E8_N1_1 TaxID=3240784 RepID=UPI003F8913E7